MAQVIVVVAAVIVDGDFILACRRSPGLDAGGKWEFPGGKVDPGETPPAALTREISEELDVGIDVGDLILRQRTRVGNVVIDLSCYRAQLADRTPTYSTDHDEMRWLRFWELENLDWAEPDRPAVAKLIGTHHLAL